MKVISFIVLASAMLSGALSVEAEEAGAELVRVMPVGEKFDTVRVTTEVGVLVGERAGAVNVFRGVPFAAPPVGERRWTAPQPVEMWAGDRAAVAHEAACPQPTPADDSALNQGGVAGPQSEDCLYLQVYAPAAAEKAPVVVWFHGGGAFLGAGHLGSYFGTANAEKGIVTVPVNYRLGALGYFAHPAISKEEGAAGAYALMDAVAALEWVRDNIGAFGGDPENVTIAGQSAGGVMVVNLLAIPSVRELFHKAVIQSGAYVSGGVEPEAAEAKAIQALEKIGIGADASASQLRSVSAQTFAYNPDLRMGLGPVLDADFFPVSAKATFAAGMQAPVPVLIGANSGEPGFQAARKIAAQVSGAGGQAWLYRFDYVPEFRKAEWTKGAIHSAELMFSFDTIGTSGWSGGKTTEADESYADLVSSCWVAFYRMPVDATSFECANGFTWPAYTAEGGVTALFADEIGLVDAGTLPDGPPR